MRKVTSLSHLNASTEHKALTTDMMCDNAVITANALDRALRPINDRAVKAFPEFDVDVLSKTLARTLKLLARTQSRLAHRRQIERLKRRVEKL